MVAFNLGAMPGKDLVAAADAIAGETGERRTIPRLPALGLGYDPVGFTCALLPDLPIDKGPRSWQLTSRPQLLSRRLWDNSDRDLDIVTEVWGTGGFEVHLSVLGPWSLATAIELANGHRAVTDSGALADIAELLGHSIAAFAQKLGQRFGGRVSLGFEEPALYALKTGRVPGTSDFDTIAKRNEQDLGQLLHHVVGTCRELVDGPIYLGSMGKNPEITALRIANPDGVLLARSAISGTAMLDACGEALGAGLRLAVGCVKLGDDLAAAPHIARDVLTLINQLQLEQTATVQQLDITCAKDLYPGTVLSAAHALRCATKVQELLRD